VLKRIVRYSLTTLIGIPLLLNSALANAESTRTETLPPLAPIAFPPDRVETESENLPGANIKVYSGLDSDSSVADQKRPVLSVGTDGAIHAAWTDERSGHRDIYYAKSTGDGATWSRNVRVNDDVVAADQNYPTLAVDEQGHVHIAWEDNRNGNYDIYYAHSTGVGETFSVNRRVNDDSGQGNQYLPAIALGPDGSLHLAWQDGRSTSSYDIYSAYSTNDGDTFSTNVRVNDETLVNYDTRSGIDVDSAGRVHVTWANNQQMYYASSSDRGVSFAPNLLIGEGITPALAVAGTDQVYVAWVKHLRDIPYYIPGIGLIWVPVFGVKTTSSSDGGESFGEPQLISDKLALNSSMWPDIAVSNDTVHVVFYRNSYDDSVIEYDRSADQGNTWDTDRLVDDGNCCPTLDADKTDHIYVAWSDNRDGSQNIYYSLSTDDGQSFSPSVQVNDGIVEKFELYLPLMVHNDSL
jgi:hypothetical protein